MQCAQVFLRGQVQPACDALELSVCRALDATTQAQRPHCELLHARVAHEVTDSRILHQFEDAFLETAHRMVALSR
jgi:hypothetical protein